MENFRMIVQNLILDGVHPRDLQDELTKAIKGTRLWIGGDSIWIQKLVCPKCGSFSPMLCSDDLTISGVRHNDWHSDQENVKQISAQEWQNSEKIRGDCNA